MITCACGVRANSRGYVWTVLGHTTTQRRVEQLMAACTDRPANLPSTTQVLPHKYMLQLEYNSSCSTKLTSKYNDHKLISPHGHIHARPGRPPPGGPQSPAPNNTGRISAARGDPMVLMPSAIRRAGD